MQNPKRATTATQRRRPEAPHQLTFTADGDGAHGPEGGPRPSELFIEPTDPSGELALWFDDVWWMDTLRRWGEQPLLIHVLPSQAALLHPVVLHQVSMVQRVAPHWRVAGYAYAAEISGDAAVETLANSAYDEVRLVEGTRPTVNVTAPPPHALRIEDLFARVRRIQQQRGAAKPVLVRARSIPPAPGDGESVEPPRDSAADRVQTANDQPAGSRRNAARQVAD